MTFSPRFSRLVLGFMGAAALSAAASAAPPVRSKNVSQSPRETIYNLPGNVQYHGFIRNDGNYGLVIHNYNQGTTQHFIVDSRTGALLPGQ
jgi:hypothetical protein